MTEEADLSLEIVILLILGIFMLLFGLLLFKIGTGQLPYNPDSAYGLFLVIVSFQVITMGKTPFGDLRRSWALIIIGMCAAILGMFACFIPGYLTEFVRVLVGIVLLLGGLTLLMQLFISERKARMWMKAGGILTQLTIACSVVYTATVLSGITALFLGLTTTRQTAILLIIYGSSFFYLSWCIGKVRKSYPLESNTRDIDKSNSKERFGLFREAALPLSQAILILLGILQTFLGLLLFPVSLRVIAFSPDGQLGLLLTVTAIQMMSLGDTPLGQVKRSWAVIIIGLAFAALGVVSSIVPGVLTGMIQILLGLLNIIGGAALLIKRYLPILQEHRTPPAAPVIVPPTIKKMMATQTAVNCVQIGFGVSMLVPGLVPGLLMAGILVVNGLLLFMLSSVLRKVTGIRSSPTSAVSM